MAADIATGDGVLQQLRSLIALTVLFSGMALTVAAPILTISYIVEVGLR